MGSRKRRNVLLEGAASPGVADEEVAVGVVYRRSSVSSMVGVSAASGW